MTKIAHIEVFKTYAEESKVFDYMCLMQRLALISAHSVINKYTSWQEMWGIAVLEKDAQT